MYHALKYSGIRSYVIKDWICSFIYFKCFRYKVKFKKVSYISNGLNRGDHYKKNYMLLEIISLFYLDLSLLNRTFPLLHSCEFTTGVISIRRVHTVSRYLLFVSFLMETLAGKPSKLNNNCKQESASLPEWALNVAR